MAVSGSSAGWRVLREMGSSEAAASCASIRMSYLSTHSFSNALSEPEW